MIRRGINDYVEGAVIQVVAFICYAWIRKLAPFSLISLIQQQQHRLPPPRRHHHHHHLQTNKTQKQLRERRKNHSLFFPI